MDFEWKSILGPHKDRITKRLCPGAFIVELRGKSHVTFYTTNRNEKWNEEVRVDQTLAARNILTH